MRGFHHLLQLFVVNLCWSVTSCVDVELDRPSLCMCGSFLCETVSRAGLCMTENFAAFPVICVPLTCFTPCADGCADFSC
jgi:hypothetical protein